MASNSVISLGIEVNGEDTLDSALKAVNAQVRSLGEGAKAAMASMDAMGKNEENAAKATNALNQQIEANQKKLDILGQKYKAANDRLEDLAKAMNQAKLANDPKAIEQATKEYNDQAAVVANLSAQMNKAEKDIAKAQGSIKQIGEDTGKMSGEADKAGNSFLELAKTLTLKVAAEGLEKVNGAIDKFVGKVKEIGSAVWSAGKEASVMADDLLTLSSTSNVSAESLQKWEYASRFIDTSVSTLTASMKKITTNMTSTSTATQEAFARLGVSVTDSTGKLRSSEDVMFDVVDALGKIDNQTERDALAMQLMGKSANELNPLIESGSKAFKALGDEAQSMGLILSDDALGGLGDFNDGLQKMDATFAGVKNQILSALAPAFTTISAKITEVAQKFAAWVQTDEAQEMLSNITDTVIRLVEEMGKNLEPVINGVISAFSTVSKVVSFVANNLDVIIPLIAGLTAGIIALKAAQLALNVATLAGSAHIALIVGAVTAAIAAAGALVSVIVKNWEGIQQFFVNLWDGVVNAFTAARDAIQRAWEGVKGFFSGIWEGVKNAALNAKTAIQNGWENVKGFFSNIGTAIGNAFTTAKDTIVNAWNNLPEFMGGLRDRVQSVWQNVDGWMSDKFGGAWEGIKNAFKPFVDFFRQMWESVKAIFGAVGDVLHGDFSSAWERIKGVFVGWGDYFKGLFNGIVDRFKELPGQIVKIGGDIVRGLWQGIQSAGTWLWDQLTGFLGGIVNGIKGFFGIKSPSRLFRDEVGLMIGLGMAEGIQESAKAVQKAYEQLLPDVGAMTAAADGFSVAARTAANDAQTSAPWQDDRPIILTLNDRELGRAVRGYV